MPFVTIGDASTAEGVFWDMTAVQQIPLTVTVWDDGYGISMPKNYPGIANSVLSAMVKK